jgi:hypothetical protein
MSISYSGLRNYGKATLPSVEAGLGSLNILRDPPKSIHTRRINKVGDSNEITQQIQDSGNRSCESIRKYARGVNPFVSVSYTNEGNNGGQRTGGCNNFTPQSTFLASNGTTVNTPQMTLSSGSAKGSGGRNPYTLGNRHNDVFRPPVFKQEDLLPLSRLPRRWTKANTNLSHPDYQKKMLEPQDAHKTVGVKNYMVSGDVRPTYTYKIEKPIEEPFEVKYVIQNPINVSGHSGMGTRDIAKQDVVMYNKGNVDSPVHYSAYTQMGSQSTIKQMDNTKLKTDKYIQNAHHNNVSTKLYSKMQTTPMNEIMDLDIHTKDSINVSYTAPQSGNKAQEYIHNDLELDRVIPSHQARTNYARDIHKTVIDNPYQQEQLRNMPQSTYAANKVSVPLPEDDLSFSERNYNRLAPKPHVGGFQNNFGKFPTNQVMSQPDNYNYESPRNSLGRKAAEFFDGRYRHGNNNVDYQAMHAQQAMHA